jgi:hypothetical protein
VYPDIRRVREHYAAIRELISLNAGGWEDVATHSRVALLCAASIAALDDFECRQSLRTVQRHAAELYSAHGHRKWDREHMSGAQYLRLQIFIALEALHTRLLGVEATRDRASQPGAQATPRPPSI